MNPARPNYKDLSDRVADILKRHNMLRGGETVLIGLSGGPDSVSLLSVLAGLRKTLELTLHAVYVDHNLRPDETPKEIELCRELCSRLGVVFHLSSIDVISYAKEHRLSKQEAARDLRYKVFEELAAGTGAGRIALAHNADDQTETLLMRLIRGTGPQGLSGIPPMRGRIIRPLIEIDRAEIERFLAAGSIPFAVDSSNLKTDYFRNSVRQALTPVFRRLNPNISKTVLHTTSILREEERYFDIIVTKALMKLISRKSVDRIELFLSPMEGMDTVILRRVLRRAISETKGLRGTSFVHIENIIRLIRDGRSGDRLYLPHGVRAIKEYSLMVMTSAPPAKIAAYELQPPGDLAIREAGVVIRAAFEESAGETGDGRSSALLDAGLMSFPLRIRPRKAGDFFFPLGFGRRKKLQDFFVDSKVPRDERDSIPVVLSGDDIVWIAGRRADERFKVTGNTKIFLRLGIVKGNF